MKTWMKTLAFVTLAALGAAACEDGGTTPDVVDLQTLRADVATVGAEAMFQDLSLMLDPPLLALPEGGPVLAAGSTRTVTKTVTFFGEDDVEQDRYDPINTAYMKVVWDMTRTSEASFWSADVTRHREMTISGLKGEETERTWDGAGTGTVAKSRHPEGGAVRTYDMTESLTITDVVWGVPRAQNPYPKGGTITRQFHAVVTKDGETVGERDVTVVVIFDGTQFAKVTAGPDSWEVDLSQGRLNQALRGKKKG